MNEMKDAGRPAQQRSHYRSYLLRLWTPSRSAEGGWLASLEDAATGRRIGFANLEELFVFLLHEGEGTGGDASPAGAFGSEVRKEN